jgi:FlaA1/EpsC-like NDP-sugar epimerase
MALCLRQCSSSSVLVKYLPNMRTLICTRTTCAILLLTLLVLSLLYYNVTAVTTVLLLWLQALMLSTAAREAVDEAAALKQHEAQQRAQLLGDLDSGRARLNRIQEGCSTLTVNKVLPSNC